MEELKQILKSKKNLISLVILVILIVAIPVGIYLVRTQKILKSRATNEIYNAFEVKDGEGNIITPRDVNNQPVYDTNSLNVNIRINNLNSLLEP